MIDLSSDTATRPSPEMRRAMADAPVGDEQRGEDPTVNALQEAAADLLGKETALFLPSATMANQIAIRVLTRPGDEILCHEDAHIRLYEGGRVTESLQVSGGFAEVTPTRVTVLADTATPV